MQVENKTSGKYSTKKNAKSCSLKLEAHRLKAVGSSLQVHIPCHEQENTLQTVRMDSCGRG